MAKGKTNQPLRIVVADEWFHHPKISALAAAGHEVMSWSERAGSDRPDLILHPAAHGWNDMQWDYLPAAVAAARRRKKARVK